MRMALGEVMGEHHFEVLSDGEKALVFVANHRSQVLKPEPCVIVIDLHLPKYNGLDVLEAARQAPALEHISVIIVSSAAAPQTVKRIEELGAHYRQKPSQLSEYEDLAKFIAAVCDGNLNKFRSLEASAQ